MGQSELHIVLVSNEPARAYPAIQLALGAAAMGHKVKVYATTAGLDVVKKETVSKIQFPGFPPLQDVLQDAIKMGVKVCACAPSADILKNLGVTKDNVVDGVALEDVIGFLNDAVPAAQKGGIVTFI
jgi:predicted peroxiredoxin